MVIFNKLPTWYADGTATVAANGTAVTGTGTVWTSLQPGDLFGVHKGLAVPISSVNSATSITLQYGWPGAAQTNATYCVQLTPRSVGVQEAIRQLLLMLGNGNLDSFANLTGTANAIPMFSGAGVLTTLASSTIGRDLLTALNSTAAYAALGEIPNAQLPTRIRALSTVVTDADTVLENGSYAVASTAANIPIGSAGILTVGMYSNTATGFQIYVRSSNGDMWLRPRSSSAWGAWGRIPNFGTDNIIPNASLPTRIQATTVQVSAANALDNIIETGWVSVANANVATVNGPNGASAGVCLTIVYGTNNSHQLYFHVLSSNVFYSRIKTGSGWTAWRRIDGDLSGPGAAVANNAFAGFNGTGGFTIKALSVLEALANLGPVAGGVAPEPAGAGVGMANGDFDTVIFPGVYTIAGSWTNGPSGAGAATYAGVLEVQARSYNNLYVQILRLQDGRVFKRIATAASGAWQAWGKTETTVPSTTVAGNFVQFADAHGNLQATTIPTATVLGRTTAGNGAVEALTAAQARTVIGVQPSAARQVRVGAQGDAAVGANAWYYVPTSSFVTGMFIASDYTVRNVTWRSIQQTDSSGNWVTVSQV